MAKLFFLLLHVCVYVYVMLLYRNATLQFVVPTETTPNHTATHSLLPFPIPFPSPADGEGVEAQKVKMTAWEKNNLLEAAGK